MRKSAAVGTVMLVVWISALCQPSQAQAFKVLHNFTNGADGGAPRGGLISDGQGNLYGTTINGGAASYGIVFKMDRAGNETVLHSFTAGSDGAGPWGRLVRSGGSFFGTTISGGSDSGGTVFRLDANGQVTILHSFTILEGMGPTCNVIMDAKGVLYGTTSSMGRFNYGTAFKLTPAGKLGVLHSFHGAKEGGTTYVGLVRDADGNLYGTTTYDDRGEGLVFKLDKYGSETVVHAFGADAVPFLNGTYPDSGLTPDGKGNLYGTAARGGQFNHGTVFKIEPSGTLTVVYSFQGGADGGAPMGDLLLDEDGNLYGTTYGYVDIHTFQPNYGSVFKITPDGKETVLHSFKGGADGGHPTGSLVLEGRHLYGTTSGFGISPTQIYYGNVYRITLPESDE